MGAFAERWGAQVRTAAGDFGISISLVESLADDAASEAVADALHDEAKSLGCLG
ncbi:hypothetical protein [Streptomyces sp. NPDC040750]|uniref:hypothetical protein n=1 Tax=Streptomyces sp. NPDC040750 TaxID=3154491 RepID=UPI0033F610C3